MIEVYTAATEEPVTIDEVMHECRIDDYSYQESVRISRLIGDARAAVEQELDRYLITQTLDAYFDSFDDVIKLQPLQSVTSITYYDTEGTSQTLASDQYQVDAVSKPARITPSYGNSWPSTQARSNAVKIRFVAGYGSAADVPLCIKNWILMTIKTAYDLHNETNTGRGDYIFQSRFIDRSLDSERVLGR